MLRVLQDSGWAGKVKFIGFDASDTLVKGLSDGHIDGLIVQDPVKMGYLGVKTMVEHLKGRPVEKRIDTGVQLITRDRMHDPAVNGVAATGSLSRWLTQAHGENAQFEMRGVRKAFGGTVALDGVDLAVRGGEVCALVGQNGAGKSTLMSILAGATAPDAGSMTLNGAAYSPKESTRGEARGRRDDLSGAVARAAFERDGQHRARNGARTHRAAWRARRDRPRGRAQERPCRSRAARSS